MAAPVTGDEVNFTNSSWSFSPEELRGASASTPSLSSTTSRPSLCRCRICGRGPDPDRWGRAEPRKARNRARAGHRHRRRRPRLVRRRLGRGAERGRPYFARRPRSARVRSRFAASRRARPSFGRARALRPRASNLYGAIVSSHGLSAEPLLANDVLTRARGGTDDAAIEALASSSHGSEPLPATSRSSSAPAAASISAAASRRRSWRRHCRKGFPSGLRGQGPHAELARSHPGLCHPCRICHAARGAAALRAKLAGRLRGAPL